MFSGKLTIQETSVNLNKNSTPCINFSLGVAGNDSAPTEIFPNFSNSLKGVELGSSYSGYRLI